MKNGQKYKVSVLGLGYVGLTIAYAFSKYGKVIGIDKNPVRIANLKENYDSNGELNHDELKNCKIIYTTDPSMLKNANFHIVAIPTPVYKNNEPDLRAMISATTTLGEYIKKNDIIVYESSVSPGITEDICIPILEKISGLKCGKDFGLGFSPERINPGDKVHDLTKIIKIISACDKITLNKIALVYGKVIKAGVYKVSSIRIAEAVKLIENAQRDINISFMNEVALILHKLGMDSIEVLKAANTKWNFLPFQPGLVGGHCIGVSASYLAHRANQAGYHPDVILAGRRVNEYMPKYLAENIVKHLTQLDTPANKARVGILGLTYKENCPDIHDSRTMDIVHELSEYHVKILIHDPIAEHDIAKKEFDVKLAEWSDLKKLDILVILVAHKEYRKMAKKKIISTLKKNGLIMDIHGILKPSDFEKTGITVWRL